MAKVTEQRAKPIAYDKKQYHIIDNVTISNDQKGTTQIDHIVISKYGIFVIETKNMKGWIYSVNKQNLVVISISYIIFGFHHKNK